MRISYYRFLLSSTVSLLFSLSLPETSCLHAQKFLGKLRQSFGGPLRSPEGARPGRERASGEVPPLSPMSGISGAFVRRRPSCKSAEHAITQCTNLT